MNTIRTPVCIVGAGPAGTTASIFLSKYGIEHVMVERKSLPFDKVCGESFAGRVMNVLNEIDPQWAAALFRNKAVIQSRVINCFWQPHKRKFKLAFPPGSKPFLKATRSFFDHALLQKARESALLTYIDNCNITEFKKQTDGVRLSDCRSGICIETNLVLMCVGDKTTSLHHIFPDYIIDGVRYLASRQYFEQVSYDDDDNATELYFYHNPFIYYIYTTRLPNNQAMVEIFTTKKYAEKMNLNLAYNLKDSLAKTERLKKRFENARPLGKPKGASLLLGTSPRKLSDDRFLLAGSSIGSVHILTGVGVGNAMRSGQLAAFWATESLKQKNYSAAFLKNYDEAVRKRFKADFRWSRLVNALNPHTRFAWFSSKIAVISIWLLTKFLLISGFFKHNQGEW